jgi:hypothetical protein
MLGIIRLSFHGSRLQPWAVFHLREPLPIRFRQILERLPLLFDQRGFDPEPRQIPIRDDRHRADGRRREDVSHLTLFNRAANETGW